MFLLFVSLFCVQTEDYPQKSFNLMYLASSNLDKNNKYYKNKENIVNLRKNSMEIARKICSDNNEVTKYANSKEVSDKITACYAYAFGMNSTVEEKLFKLLLDENNLVTMAARESFVFIVNKKLNNFVIDQGPSHHADIDEKYQASAMWRTIFSKHNLINGQLSNNEEKAYKKFVDILNTEESRKFFRRKKQTQLETEDYYFLKSKFPQLDEEMEQEINPEFFDPNDKTVQHKHKRFGMIVWKLSSNAFGAI